MIVTVKDDYDKSKGTDLPMFSRVGKTTVNMYIAFSQAAMNNHEEEEYLKANPNSNVQEFRDKKKQRMMRNNDDGGLASLKDQREQLLKSDETVVGIIFHYCVQTLKEIESYFSDIRNKRKDEKTKTAEDIKAKKDSTKIDKRYAFIVNKTSTANFKSQTRDKRDLMLCKLDTFGNDAPEIGKYNPKHAVVRR